jgi:small subunit ribosomal protein S17
MATQATTTKRRLTGVVKSDKMKDTIVVEVTRYEKHAKYHKFLKLKKRFKADDKGNTKKVGETVEIEECRPISKDKRFKVVA